MGSYFNTQINSNNKFKSPFLKFKKEKRIKSVTLESGYVKIKTAKSFDKEEEDFEIKLLSELTTYYPFIGKEILPKLHDLDLEKLLVMFASLQYLFTQIAKIKITNHGVQKISDFYKFPFRIKIKELKNFFNLKLKFSSKQINSFFSLIEGNFSKNCRINIWNKPLIKYKDEYLFTLLGVADSITLHLMDNWLHDGGFSLRKRGHLLEKYIKKQIQYYISLKGYFGIIPQKSMFKVPNIGKEEIDLLINLKNILIVAEVKCIKYPMEVRDYHNSYKTLEKASNQVIRKSKFIKNNLTHFDKELNGITGKDIVNIVITNFPNYSGFIINNIPIIDLYLLEAYVLSGKISNSKIYSNEKGKLYSNTISQDYFYKNEDEFSNNFESTMKAHPAISQIKSNIKMQWSKKSPEFLNYDIIVNEAIFKD